MQSLRDVLEEADRTGIGIGHYNISDLIGLEAVAEAAREVGVPVIVGLSEGERKFMGTPVVRLATTLGPFRQFNLAHPRG